MARPTLRPPRPRWAPSVVVGVVALVAALVGCGGGDGATGPCGPVQREPLDQRAVHVLPGGPAPHYRTDPPTSGPHLPSPATEAVRSDPVPPPIQVGLLEEGGVLIQHTELSDADRERVESLAGDGVVVAPADTLPGRATVVATAWVTKQVCDAVDIDVLATFATDQQGHGPGGHE